MPQAVAEPAEHTEDTGLTAPATPAWPVVPVVSLATQQPMRASRPWHSLVPVALAVAGLLFAMSFQTAAGTDFRSERGLPGLVQAADADLTAASARLAELQAEVDALTAAQAPGNNRLEILTTESLYLAPVAGARAVAGPTVTVVLDDSPFTLSALPESVRVDDLVVHQQDVQAVVNALWRGGAEAMMIQDQRVVATTAVRCVGNTLMLQGRVYSPPFTIKAIGDHEALVGALDEDEQIAIYRQWVDVVGLGYDVSVADSEILPAFAGSVAMVYANVAR